MSFQKKNDKWISVVVFLITLFFVFLVTRPFFLEFASSNKLLGGFIKFFLLASIGDFVGYRLKTKVWGKPNNMFLKAVVWGIIGIVIVMMFEIFPSGILVLQEKNLLPFEGNTFAFAFFTSLFMNVVFAPTMMLFHRISDTYLEQKGNLKDVISRIDFYGFVNNVLFKTIPFFWIPAHTITFLIPEEYRVILAAVLGIFLGLLLSVFKKVKE